MNFFECFLFRLSQKYQSFYAIDSSHDIWRDKHTKGHIVTWENVACFKPPGS